MKEQEQHDHEQSVPGFHVAIRLPHMWSRANISGRGL
jgi:hypothetical protein